MKDALKRAETINREITRQLRKLGTLEPGTVNYVEAANAMEKARKDYLKAISDIKKSTVPALLKKQANPIEKAGRTITAAQLKSLRKIWEGVEKVKPSELPKVRELFAKLSDEDIEEIKNGKINFLSSLAVNELGSRKAKKINPVGVPNTQTKIEQAIRLFERFRLDEPKFVDELPAPAVDVAMTIGFLDAVEYTTKRAGKVELYRHEFAKKSRPLLVSSWDGTQLLILGGKYDFTKDGIIDK